MSQNYDVVFYGLDRARGSEDESIAGLTKVFGTDRNQVDALIAGAAGGNGVVVKRNVNVNVALKLKGLIEQAGGISDYRPTRPSESAALQLVPIEATEEKPRFVCPACNHKEDPDAEGNLPKICPACGVVADKYDQVSALKAEREKVRRQLLASEQYREKQAAEADQRKKSAELREALEAEIRKELGIPKALSTRGRLISTGAAIWGSGLIMGLIGMSFYNAYFAPENKRAPGNLVAAAGAGIDPAQLAAGHPTVSSEGDFESSMLPPSGMDAVQQIAKIADKLPMPAAVAGAAAVGLPGGRESGVAGLAAGIDPAGGPETAEKLKASDAVSSLLPEPAAGATQPDLPLLTYFEQDREWNRFLASEVERLLAAGKFENALKTAQVIPQPDLKAQSLWSTAERMGQAGDAKGAAKAQTLLDVYIDGLPDPASRVQALTSIAGFELDKGDRKKAESLRARVETLADALSDPVQKALALGRLAPLSARFEEGKKVGAYFARAGKLLSGAPDKVAALRGYAQLAESYAAAGDSGGAAAVLNGLTHQASRVADENVRVVLVRDIALGFGIIGNLDSAIEITRKIGSGPDRDRVRSELAKAQVFANRPYDAMKVLEDIESPQHRAPAATLLGLSLERDARTRHLAGEVLKNGMDAAAAIKNPIDKALALAEMGRFASRSAGAAGVRERFTQALAIAQGLTDPRGKDLALAAVAGNQVRAGMTAQARQAIATIKEPALAKQATDDLALIGPLFDSEAIKSPVASNP